MDDPRSPPLPSWVRKRDGRLAPFEADRLARALFGATESRGRPDAFLARELADVALHFLAEECEGTTPETGQVRDGVLKVLRQLKQHELATAFAEGARTKEEPAAPPPLPEAMVQALAGADAAAARTASLRAYSLQHVFSRDLAAAHRDGLLTLGGLESPGELASCSVGAIRSVEEVLPRLEEAARRAGDVLALDGVEHGLAGAKRKREEELAHGFAQELERGLRLLDRRAVVNLNAPPPPWADEEDGGPLFASSSHPQNPSRAAALARQIAEALLDTPAMERVRIDWHVSDDDLPSATLPRAILEGRDIALVFDRPRKPVALAEGMDRKQPAVLLAVSLNLPRLMMTLASETIDPARRAARLRDKLRSLARLALSAALRKREFLRRHLDARPSLASGFLLERARLLAMPQGLGEAVRYLRDLAWCGDDEMPGQARAILEQLRFILQSEGRDAALEVALETPTEDASALTPRQQLKLLGERLHAAGGGGGAVVLPEEPTPNSDTIADTLRWGRGQSSLTRLFVKRARPALRQMTFPGE